MKYQYNYRVIDNCASASRCAPSTFFYAAKVYNRNFGIHGSAVSAVK